MLSGQGAVGAKGESSREDADGRREKGRSMGESERKEEQVAMVETSCSGDRSGNRDGRAGLEQVQFHPGLREFRMGGLVIDGDGREGVEMDANDLLRSDPLGGGGGILRPHGEVVPEAKGGPGELVFFTEDFHIHGQGRIAGEIERALGGGYDKTAGIAAVSSIGQHGAVDGRDVINPAEGKNKTAAMIERMRFLDTLGTKPGHDLVI